MKLQKLKNYKPLKDKKLLKLELLKTQGLCNKNYKLQTSNNEFLIRVFKHQHKDIKRRQNEFKTQKKAYKKGIASKPYILDEKNSLMICDFIKGKHKSKLKNIDIKAVAKTLKKLHSIKTKKKAYDLKSDFKHYNKTLTDKKSRKLCLEAFKELKKIKKYKKELVICHHDLNQQNLLFHKNRCFFIDWEFSCVNDRFFDIASICVEFKLNKKQEEYLLKQYLKNKKNKDLEKLNSYKLIYINLWKLWFKELEK